MDAYVYRAALYCEEDANKIKRIVRGGKSYWGIAFNRADSEDYPQGPFYDGGGESDAPQHCDECAAFLENPLTDEGRAYVEDAIADFDHYQSGNAEIVNEWRDFYLVTAL